MKRRNSSAGYSLIEVMTAVAIMIVGSTGVAMMVGATTRANDDAWETTTASAFAATWMERVKRDALLWTAAGEPATTYLSSAMLDTREWYVPAANFALTGESPAADAFGWDTDNQDEMRYCVNLSTERVHRLTTGLTNAVRVNLRVYWARTVRGDVDVSDRRLGPAAGCVPLAASSPLIREMYLSTIVHWVAP
jgi:Tfp pilus assembly protein PilV